MRQVIEINQSTNPALTTDHLLQLCAALAIQNQRDYAPAWRGQKDPSGNVIDADATFSAAQADAGIPVDAIPAFTQDALPDAPDDLGYHDQESGVGVCRVGLSPILNSGGTILTGSNSWSVTHSHEEGIEVLGDWDADEWVHLPDGETDLAFEHGDPVEAFSYDVDVPAIGALPAGKVSVSDFVLPAYYIPGSAGPWDFLGKLSGPLTKGRACYQILRNRKTGDVRNEFGREMAEWRKAEIEKKCATPGTRHHKRHHGHKAKMAAEAPPAASPANALAALGSAFKACELAAIMASFGGLQVFRENIVPSPEGAGVLVPVGVVGLGVAFTIGFGRSEARAIARKLLDAAGDGND